MWPWPTIKFQICSKMTKKAILRVSSDLNDEPFSKRLINFRLEIILKILENTFFLPRVRTYAKKSSKKCQFLISAHFAYIKDPQMYRKNVVSAAPGKSPPNFMKLFFQVCFMNRLGEKMVQLILKILVQTDHPSIQFQSWTHSYKRKRQLSSQPYKNSIDPGQWTAQSSPVG